MIVMLRSKDETTRIRNDLARKCPRHIVWASDAHHGVKPEPREAEYIHQLVIKSTPSCSSGVAGSFVYQGVERFWHVHDDVLAIGY